MGVFRQVLIGLSEFVKRGIEQILSYRCNVCIRIWCSGYTAVRRIRPSRVRIPLDIFLRVFSFFLNFFLFIFFSTPFPNHHSILHAVRPLHDNLDFFAIHMRM